MRIITCSTHKGGAGKSTVVGNLGYYLSKMGKRILFIDTDSQMNLTQSYNLADNIEKSFYKAYLNKDDIKKHIIPTKYENIDFVSGEVAIANIERRIFSMNFWELRMKEMLENIVLDNIYDYVLIDTSPSLGMLNTSILHATDEIIIPVEPSAFGLKGLSVFLDHYNSVKLYHKNLNILGIVLNKIDKRENISTDASIVIKKIFGENMILDTKIHVDACIKNAQWANRPLGVYVKEKGIRTKSKAANDFVNLAKEVDLIVQKR